MPRPRRTRAIYVGTADYRANYEPQTDLRISDDWPSRATLASHRLTLEAYKRMYELQGGRCAICEVEKEPLGLVIDHNHRTRKVRGLLCSSCNIGLGQFKDSPDILEVALQYLEERGCYGPNALGEEAS